MQRRTALQLTAALPFLGPAPAPRSTSEPFKLAFAPHAGMFRHHAGPKLLDQIRWAADQGFTAWEDNGMMARPAAEQEAIGDLLRDRGMRMGVFVANRIDWKEPTMVSGPGDYREEFLAGIRQSVDVARRCGATWMTVVPGHLDHRLEPMYQFANVVETLKRAAALLEPHGLVMVLEPLNFRDHPGLFLTKAAQAYAVCKAVASPSCKILFDVYHQQIQEGNLIPNIDAAWEEIAYFQLGDNPGRKEPGTGEIHYANVLRHVHEKGYTGIYGMEHGNSQPGKAGEVGVVEAYRRVDLMKG